MVAAWRGDRCQYGRGCGSLAYLVKRRWLTATGGSAGFTMYGLNKNRQYALRQFLQSQPSVH